MVARYICIEGTEGVGKTTQTQKLVDYLRSRGHRVLQTKEPGTIHAPLTMELRNIMLNAAYDSQLTMTGRELISQAIRSIHLEKVIMPALDDYDFIIQDRGILSGLAYGTGCGNSIEFLDELVGEVCRPIASDPADIYADLVYLTGDVRKGLDVAKSAKQEFAAGDAIEMKGYAFMERVSGNMLDLSDRFPTTIINVDYKTIDTVFSEILRRLSLGE